MPAVVDSHDELVLANSRLALIAVVGRRRRRHRWRRRFSKLTGAAWVLRLGMVIFGLGIFAALAIPKAKSVGAAGDGIRAGAAARAEHRDGRLRDGAGARRRRVHHLLRGVRAEEAGRAGLGVRAGDRRERGSGTRSGTLAAPLLRKRVREEWILAGSLIAPAVPLLFAARSYGRVSLIFAAGAVAAGAALARLAFDSLLQRDGAEAARGRAFARFETRFQLSGSSAA